MIEVMLFAFTIFSEALHEPILGKVMVASVVCNRVSDSNSDYFDILLKPKQFSCFDSFAVIKANHDKIALRRFDFLISMVIATNMYYGRIHPIIDARHYTNKNLRRSWMKDMIIEITYWNHQFLIENK
jgi:ABC-type enterochelin transport system permease subunit